MSSMSEATTPWLRMVAAGVILSVCVSGVGFGQAMPVAGAAQPARVGGSSAAANGEAVARPTLWVGDPAPALQVETWIKPLADEAAERGSRGEAGEWAWKGKPAVVEFWASWCGPCVENIPQLTELQRTYADAGLRVIGMASQELSPEAAARFVSRQADRMGYAVALDAQGASHRTWMEAAGQRSIPMAFVINAQGVIAWIGHPQDGLAQVVAKVMDGTHDLGAAAAAHRRRMELELTAAPVMDRFRAASEEGNHADAIAAADELVKLDAREFGRFAVLKFQIQAGVVKDAERASREALQAVQGPIKNNVAALVNLARAICDDPRIETRDYALAQQAAARAHELTEGKRADISILLGRVAWAREDRAAAIEAMTQAVKLANVPAEKERAQRLLDEYTAASKK